APPCSPRARSIGASRRGHAACSRRARWVLRIRWYRAGGSTTRAVGASTTRAPPSIPERPPPCSCAPPRAFAAKIVGVEGIEDGPAVPEPRLVLAVRPGDPGDQMLDARGLLTVELLVLQVDVVHDLGERPERLVLQGEGTEHHLEGAEVAVVRELGVEHVEAKLPRRRRVAACRNELEGGLLVDEASDEPGAGDAVDVDALAGDPRPLLRLRDRERARAPRRLARSRLRGDALLEARDEPFGGFAARRAEEVDLRDPGEALAEARETAFRRGTRLVG